MRVAGAKARRASGGRHGNDPQEKAALGAGIGSVAAMTPLPSRNVLGGPLRACSQSPVTGFFRNGHCDTCTEDVGCHTVCVEMTAEFLRFSLATGNDLTTPRPQFDFPGLQPGDRWCVCAVRWLEALEAGKAAPVVLAATHERTLEEVPLELLQQHATA